MANKQINIDIKVDSNVDAATNDMQQLNNAIKTTTQSTKQLDDAQDDLGKSMKGSKQSVLDNGGAMGLLNDATGGYAMMVKDAVEASELFANTQIKERVVKIANTIATNVATAAQWLWNTAILANPVGAFIVAIAALGAGIYALTKYFIDNADAAEKQAASVKKTSKELDNEAKAIEKSNTAFATSNEHRYNMAKASGASEKALIKLAIAINEEEIATNFANATKLRNIALTEEQILANLKLEDADEEVIKQQVENVKKAQDNFNTVNSLLKKDYQDRVELSNQLKEQVVQDETDARKEREKTANEKAAKDKVAQDKAKEEIKKYNKEINDLMLEFNIDEALIPTVSEEQLSEFNAGLEELTNSVETNNAAQTQSAVDKFKIDTGIINDTADAKIADAKVDELAAKAREEHFAAGSAQLKNAAALLGESTDAGKAAAIASTTIDTYQSSVAAYKSLAGIPYVGPVLGAVAAGIAIASGLATVKKIVAVKTPKGGGGGAAPSGGNSFSSTPLTPQVNLVGNSNNLNSAIPTPTGQNQEFTVKAVVSETEITNKQAFISKIKSSAEI